MNIYVMSVIITACWSIQVQVFKVGQKTIYIVIVMVIVMRFVL